MNFSELKREARIFYPAFALDKILSPETRKFFLRLFGGVFLLLLIIAIADYFSQKLSIRFLELPDVALGLMWIFAALWLSSFLLKSFYDSYANIGLPSISGEKALKSQNLLNFETAFAVLNFSGKDAALFFLSSSIGSVLLFRLGISSKDFLNFSKARQNFLQADTLRFEKESDRKHISFAVIADKIFIQDKEFALFLSSRKISKEDFVGAAEWVEWMFLESRKARRFWGRDNLGRLPGIGKDWAYGEANTLKKFSSAIQDIPEFSTAEGFSAQVRSEVIDLETILSRSRGANAILVANTDEDALRVAVSLGRMVANGSAMSSLENKRIFVLNSVFLVSAAKTKDIFESEFLKLLNESVTAGNIILVIPNLAGFSAEASKINSDVFDLIKEFLVSPSIHIVATSNVSSFHSSIEPNQELLRNFEKVFVKEDRGEMVLEILKKDAIRIENESGVFFLFQALRAAVDSASRYFSEGSSSDKANDLLLEAIPAAKTISKKIIGAEDILKLVEHKTGVPTGEIGGGERAKLSNLEAILSERIVGQEEAVKSISGAMRRARSGVGNPNRPIGSFLFLGSTGVGKTETAKALASVFFGGEGDLMRIDMSEYKTPDALERLIGSWNNGKQGILSSMLRDKPYGVLLLDEFEKANKEVMDLFLQVLDEGFFSDASGKRVSARNTIVIATSNAGSELIWNIVKEGGFAELNKDEIVSAVINQGIFKPELLNRFDGVIVFHPLGEEHLRKIATLMLKKLGKRLEGKGIEILITPELVEALVKKGADPKFGARPMNRAIQDKVEQLIADKIIRGGAPPGTKIEFTKEEIDSIAS